MSSSGTSPPDLPIFVLDESFPQPIVGATVLRSQVRKRVPLDIRLLEDVDQTLYETHDHHLIRALDAQGVEGLFTCDDAMVFRPEVLRAIGDTGFTVVTAQRAGDDPILASGLVLVHLGEIAAQHRRGNDQIWRLGAAPSRPMSVEEHRERNIR